MKTFLNIIIGLLIIVNMAFGIGFYNYMTKNENKTWIQVKNFKINGI